MTRVGVYGALVLLAVALVLVPIVGGATVCVDDFAWIRIAHGSESLWRALLDSWPRQLFFRPIDVVANRLVDPRTLVLAPLLTVQGCGLALVSLGVLRLLGRCGGRAYPARAAALVWLWMHPATQLSVWSAGCSSQTWCAAAGILTTAMLLERPRGQGAECTTLGLLAGASALGVICKELFVGWATALALLAWAIDPAHDGPGGAGEALKRSAPRMLALLLPPAAWIAARWLSSEFGEVSSAETGLYTLQGPLRIGTNSAIALLGMFVQGPVHWARLLGWPWNLVPFVGAGLSVWCAWEGGRLVDSRQDAALPRRLLAWFVGIGLVAVWPALLIRHVSELYLFGPNALVAVLIGLGIDAGWRRTAEPWRRTWRLVGACLFVVAAIGFISRSRHFLTTWEYARVLRDDVHRSTANLEKERISVRIPAALFAGPMHSKYCVPPAIAAALPEAWSSRRLIDDDGPLILFVDERDEHAAPPSSEDLRLRPEIRPREIW